MSKLSLNYKLLIFLLFLSVGNLMPKLKQFFKPKNVQLNLVPGRLTPVRRAHTGIRLLTDSAALLFLSTKPTTASTTSANISDLRRANDSSALAMAAAWYSDRPGLSLLTLPDDPGDPLKTNTPFATDSVLEAAAASFDLFESSASPLIKVLEF